MRTLPALLLALGAARPRATLLVCSIVVMAAGAVASQLQFDGDVLSLVPRGNPAVRDFVTTIERFGSADRLLVVVRLDPLQEDSGIAFAEAFAGRIRETGLVDWLQYRVDFGPEALSPLLDRATLFLAPEQLRALLASLDERGLERHAARIHSQLLSPHGAAMKPLLLSDPMALLPAILTSLNVDGLDDALGDREGLFIDSSRRMLLMVARPNGRATDIPFARRLAAGLDHARQGALEDWRNQCWEGDPPVVEYGGGPIIALEDARLVVRDLAFGGFVTLAGVLAMFFLAFRKVTALLYVVAPLSAGITMTFAAAALGFGTLNSVAASFGALLLGLGVDFVVVLYGRYVAERNKGENHAGALEQLGGRTSAGVILGAGTTAVAFLAFLITPFRGLAELGLLTGVGIMVIAALVFPLFAALTTLLEDSRGSSVRRVAGGFGVQALMRFAISSPRCTLTLAGLLTLVAAFGVARVSLDDDVEHMRSGTNEGVRVQREVAEAFGLRPTALVLRFDGSTVDRAVAQARAALPVLSELVERGVLARAETLAHLVPTAAQQQEVMAQLRVAAIDAEHLRASIGEALVAAGLNPAPFAAGAEHLVRAVTQPDPLSLDDLRVGILESALERYVSIGPFGASTAIYCYLPPGAASGQPPAALVDTVATLPGAVLTGPGVVAAELRSLVWREGGRALAVGLILVSLLLAATARSVRDTVLTLVPVALGSLLLFGAMGVLGIPLSFLNAFALTMILGIAVDYGIHLLHRWHESPRDFKALSGTVDAVAVAALTTVAGFGSLVFSHLAGLRSMGVVAIIGAIAVALVSVTVLPALLVLLAGKEKSSALLTSSPTVPQVDQSEERNPRQKST